MIDRYQMHEEYRHCLIRPCFVPYDRNEDEYDQFLGDSAIARRCWRPDDRHPSRDANAAYTDHRGRRFTL